MSCLRRIIIDIQYINTLVMILIFTACPEPPDNDMDTSISLSLDYAGLREVWLKISVEEPSNGWAFQLERNGAAVMMESVMSADTVVIDTGVNVSTVYQYRVFRLLKGELADSSGLITVNTMDSTSHEFTFVVDTLSETGILRDVFIIDESNVWVVGEIEKDGELYGAAVWDGEHWQLKKLEAGGSNVRPRGIWVFSDDDVWFSSGSIYHWNGTQTTLKWLRDISTDETVEKVWGLSPSNIYFVGKEGTIVHYDGTTFTKMESGTDVDLQDVWGLDEEHVWVIGRNVADAGVAFLKLEDLQWKEVDPNYQNQGLGLSSVWTDNLETLYMAGSSGRWGYSLRDSVFFDLDTVNVGKWVAYKIRGNSRNDIFTSGDGSELIHYNGSSWFAYQDLKDIGGDAIAWLSVDIKGDFVIACGFLYIFPQGIPIVARGYRNM